MKSGSISRAACTSRARAFRSETGIPETSTFIGVGTNWSADAFSSGNPGTGAAEANEAVRSSDRSAARMGRRA